MKNLLFCIFVFFINIHRKKNIFSTLSTKSQNRSRSFNINVTALSGWFYKLVFRVEREQQEAFDNTLICQKRGCVWISINLTILKWKIHETHKYEWFHPPFRNNQHINWVGFYYNQWKYLVFFYCNINFISTRSWKSVKEYE